MMFPRLSGRARVQICLQELDVSQSPLVNREDGQVPQIPHEDEETKYSFHVDDVVPESAVGLNWPIHRPHLC